MDMQREELERLMFFEQTRENAAAEYVRSPTDADVGLVARLLRVLLRCRHGLGRIGLVLWR